MDDDGSKTVSYSEFTKALRETGVIIDESSAKKLFQVRTRDHISGDGLPRPVCLLSVDSMVVAVHASGSTSITTAAARCPSTSSWLASAAS